MKKSELVKIAIAETSVIVRNGLTATLRYLPRFKVQVVETDNPETLRDCLRKHSPDILIVNPSFGGYFDIGKTKNEQSHFRSVKYVALQTSFIDHSLLKNYDAVITLFDDIDTLSEKIGNLLNEEESDETEMQDTLSTREKEIITCIAKEMTNKEIADLLCLSIHTVITHRRNIAKKLQIHSPAGLTIYAIANHLIEMKDLKVR